jgi:23S rRNA pseudouridine1911/1915/1917 synthase
MAERLLVGDDGGLRLDKYLAQARPELSRSQIQRLIAAGAVTVDGRQVKASYIVRPGDLVVMELPPPEPPELLPEPAPLEVIYEDDDLLVINKPAGLVMYPAAGHRSGTLVNALLARYPEMGAEEGGPRAGIVHRLDKETSGLIVVARTGAVRLALQEQFKRRQVHKVYLALLEGRPPQPRGMIDAPVGRDPRQRKRMAVVHDGRPARTLYRVLENFAGYTLVQVEPETGRTHQIRVHFAWLGCPVAGDAVYGRRKKAPGSRKLPASPQSSGKVSLELDRQFLHAWKLRFALPATGEEIECVAPLPPELESVLAELRRMSTNPA